MLGFIQVWLMKIYLNLLHPSPGETGVQHKDKKENAPTLPAFKEAKTATDLQHPASLSSPKR